MAVLEVIIQLLHKTQFKFETHVISECACKIMVILFRTAFMIYKVTVSERNNQLARLRDFINITVITRTAGLGIRIRLDDV